jgi:hypothetical protein
VNSMQRGKSDHADAHKWMDEKCNAFLSQRYISYISYTLCPFYTLLRWRVAHLITNVVLLCESTFIFPLD